MKKKTDNKGFSLVELIIVIAIMVILVAVLAPQYLRYVEKSRVATDTQTTVEFINVLQVAAADPDAKLDKSKSYKVESASGAEKITATTDLVTVLVTNLGLMESGSFAAAGGGGTQDSTSVYQSTAYKDKLITLELKYNTTTALWEINYTGVDNSGAILP